MINTVWEIRTALEDPTTVETSNLQRTNAGSRGLTIALFQLLVGIVTLLVVGSRVLVSGASSAATLLGVPLR